MHPSAFAISMRPEPFGSEGPSEVVAKAEAELVARYGGLDPSELGLTAAMFEPPAGTFLIARTDGRAEPVGGVGLRTVAPGIGEVRRLWVDPACRGHGIGRELMANLEAEASNIGLSVLRLATGDRQPEAVELYRTSGWERVFVTPEGAPLAPGWIRFHKVVG
ncbi:MAG TPA: GNAT family N-acetyltransferase [Acidimicrobiales bacterium]|jgi:GNAT superfamily N-acetyltransferase|nr:GNAT family N-acetyltransferase [Acidimicrobiales bacterium]